MSVEQSPWATTTHGQVHLLERVSSALRLIDRHGCSNYTSGRCWDAGRTRGAPYTADSWCKACVAADALGDTWCDTRSATPDPEPTPTTAAPELPDGYRPGCPNWRCACWRPGAVCNEFMGLRDNSYCPRCGWTRDRHNSPQPEPGATDP